MLARSHHEEVSAGNGSPLDNTSQVGDGRKGFGGNSSHGHSSRSGGTMGMEMREMTGQNNANAPFINGHAVHVAQQMTQLALDIEQLLLLAQDVSAQARQVVERLREVRASETRMPEREAALLAQLQSAQREWQRLTEGLQQAQAEALRLQGELPTANFQDLQERLRRAEEERVRLERELEPLEKALAQKRESVVRGDAYGKRKGAKAAAAATVRGPVHDSALAADAGDGHDTGAPGRLAPAAQKELGKIVDLVNQMVSSPRHRASGKGAHTAWNSTPINAMTATLQSRWSAFIAQMNVEGWMDVNQLIQWVMREAYVSNTEDLKFYAHRVKFFTDLKKMIREELTRARAFQSQHQSFGPNDSSTLSADFEMYSFANKPVVLPDGTLRPQEPTARGTTRDGRELEAYIKELDQMLNSVGDDAQLAQLDLQTVTQKQQQTLQTLSNLSKVLHETSMAIIRKIGS